MDFTDEKEQVKGISDAILRGMRFKPSEFPTAGFAALGSAGSIAELAFEALAPYFAGDRLFGELPEICYEAFDFPIPLVQNGPNCRRLELGAGPGKSYADFGARFMACIMARLKPDALLSAQSEEASWAEAFKGRSQKIVIGETPAGAIAVDGRNTAFIMGLAVPFVFASMREAIMANSRYQSREVFLSSFIIPSSCPELLEAAFYARAMGAPVGKVVAAELGDHDISDFLRGSGPAPESLDGLLTFFSAKDLRENLQAWPSSADSEIDAFEAVRAEHFPVQQTIVVRSGR